MLLRAPVVIQGGRVRQRLAWTMVAVLVAAGSLGCSAQREAGVSPSTLTPADWISLSKPGVPHQLLGSFVGTWDVTISSRSAPDVPPEVSKGVSNISWLLGGRFVREDFKGSVAGEKYEGVGFLGFDNGARLFSAVWMDSLNTSVALSKGRFNEKNSTFQFTGEIYDPLLGRTKTNEMQIKLISSSHYEVSMIDVTPRGERFKALTMVYRKK